MKLTVTMFFLLYTFSCRENYVLYKQGLQKLFAAIIFCQARIIQISLGKGRESLHLKPYIKLIISALSDLPPACNDLDKVSTMHLKIAQNMYIFSREFCTFPVTEGNKIQHIYSSL